MIKGLAAKETYENRGQIKRTSKAAELRNFYIKIALCIIFVFLAYVVACYFCGFPFLKHCLKK